MSSKVVSDRSSMEYVLYGRKPSCHGPWEAYERRGNEVLIWKQHAKYSAQDRYPNYDWEVRRETLKVEVLAPPLMWVKDKYYDRKEGSTMPLLQAVHVWDDGSVVLVTARGSMHKYTSEERDLFTEVR